MPAPSPAPTRFTLRQLPLPAKLVATLFLLTVGLGYSSAMVQMHFQHTQGDGTPIPGKADVIEIFAGKKRLTREEIEKSRPISKMEKLVMGPIDGPLTGSGSMGSAFFKNDKSDSNNRYKDAILKAPKDEVDAQREGERTIFKLWINAPEAARRTAYEDNRFVPPDGNAPAKFSPEYFHKEGSGFLIRQMFADRCVACHQDGGQASSAPLESYEQIAKYAECPQGIVVPDGQDWAWSPSDRQISKEKLAQSTHAHLLSFAMLFSLTGLAFAFTSYPGLLRGILGPIVLLAQVADVSCWWLARLDGPGIYFAQAILATGAVVGIGLILQIVLSVFNMYGPKGKFVLAAIFLGAAAGGGLVAVKVAIPQLDEQKAKKAKLEIDAKKKADDAAKRRPVAPAPAPAGPKDAGTGKKPTGPSTIERLFTGKWENGPWPKDGVVPPEGGMVRALFDKDNDFKSALKEKDKDAASLKAFQDLLAERESEQGVVLAWIKSAPDARKQAYEDDKFPIPTELKGRPMTAEFLANDKAVKIQSLFEARCSSCHGGASKVSLDGYDKFEKYFK